MPTCPKMTRLKYICELIVDCEHKTAPTQETGYPLIRTPNIGLGHLILNGVNRVSEEIYQEWSRRTIPQAEDLILAREAPVGNVAIIPKNMKVCLGQRTVLIRPDKNKTCSTFLVYLMLGDDTQARLLERSTGSTVHHLNMTDIRNLELPTLPPLPVQNQIADFLDQKTGQIDELIRIKERRIKLLQEQRTALINQSVTKGLDPNVEMKPSGVEWIGEIPAHWTISKVKHVFDSLDNLRIPLNSETRGNMELKIYDYYGASGVIDKVENYIFDEPLILIGEDGANLYLRSTPLAFKATGKYWVNNHAHILKPKCGNIDYLTNMLESLDYTHYITGAAQPKLTSEHLMNIAVINPPPLEQTQIANFLNYKTRQIDKLISAEQRKIELLKEYRQSLISEAVTGKIDVRNEV